MHTIIRALLLFYLLILPSESFAFTYSFSGFASFGAGHVSEPDLTFGDYDDHWGVDTDTMVGLQFQTPLWERLGLTIQGISRGYSYDDHLSRYEPELDWLFLSYELTSNLRIRTGRLRMPHYLYSETLEVGYSYIWVRPPVDVYTPALESFRNFNGADITWYGDLSLPYLSDTAEYELQLFTGVTHGKFLGNSVDVSPAVGFNILSNLRQLKLRYGFIALKASIDNEGLNQLIPLLNQASGALPPLADVAEGFSDDHEWYQYHGLGLIWDWHQWTLTAERYYILGSGSGLSNEARGWYISLHRPFGMLTPYLVAGTYSNHLQNGASGALSRSFDLIPQGVDASLDQLRTAASTAIDVFKVKERTYTAGLRWDVLANTALKMEYQFFEFMENSTGHLLLQDNAQKPKNASMISMVLDVVF